MPPNFFKATSFDKMQFHTFTHRIFTVNPVTES